MRTTPKMLDDAARNLSEITGMPFFVQWAYSRPRLELKRDPGVSGVSPRLPSGQLLDWINAFIAGYELRCSLERESVPSSPDTNFAVVWSGNQCLHRRIPTSL